MSITTKATEIPNDWQKLLKKQQYDRVLNTANAILNIDINNQDALFYQALALYQSEREELATPYFSHLINQYNNKSNHISAYRLALCYFYLGNNENAVQQFNKVLAQPNPPSNTQLMLAYALAKNNQLTEAAKVFDILLAKEQNHSLYYNRALVYLGLNNLTAAELDLQNAIAAKTNFHLPYFDLISIYVLQDKTDKAIIWLEKLLANRETNLARLQQDPVLTDFIESDAYVALLKKYKIN